MSRILKTLFTEMDSIKALILLLIAANIAIGAMWFSEYQVRRGLDAEIAENKKGVDLQLKFHARLRKLFQSLAEDQLAGKARNSLTDYIYNATQFAVLPQPQKLREVSNKSRNIGKISVVEQELAIGWTPEQVRDRIANDGDYRGVKGGFTQLEVQKLLFALEKNSARVKINKFKMVPFNPDSRGRNFKLPEVDPNKYKRWSIENLSILSRRLGATN